MGREGFEYLLGFHAAPMFRGLKGGSLLSFRKSRFRDFDRLLASYEPCFRCKGISVFRVTEGEEYVLLLFYRRHVLERNLKRGLARKILQQCGYREEDTLDQMLARLQARMRLQKHSRMRSDCFSIIRRRMWKASLRIAGESSAAAVTGRCMPMRRRPGSSLSSIPTVRRSFVSSWSAVRVFRN